MVKILITSISLLLTVGIKAQTFEWARSFGDSLSEFGNSITVDALGNVYTAGYFQGTVDLDPGAGTVNFTSAGEFDAYVQKLDASGNFVWAKTFGGILYDAVNSITVDATGNIYTTGYFNGTVDLDPGAGVASFTTAGSTDAFVQKLDASGNFMWAKSFGGSSHENGISITLDASGNIYTTGYFNGTVDFDPGLGVANLSSAGNNDVFIQKLDTSGNFIWAKSVGWLSDDQGLSITVDNSGNVFTAGYFSGTIDFDPGPGLANLSSAGNNDVFVQKLDASGNFVWAKSFGGSSDDEAFAVAVDASGNTYTTGFFRGTADFDPGAGTTNLTSAGHADIFVHKLDASGNFIWAKSIEGGLEERGYSIAVDTSGNVYTTGYFYGTMDFDPGVGISNLTSAGVTDIFVQKLDTDGNFIWAKSFGGGSNETAQSIFVDASGNLYTTGRFSGTADFDPGAGTANLTSAGLWDVFVQKMSQSSMAGTPGNTFDKAIKVFPNPFGESFTIDLGNEYESTEITVRDVMGRIVSSSNYSSTSIIHISLEETAGIYFIEIASGGKMANVKLIKE